MRQQAEFFAKLERIDEAMEVLEDGIRGNPKESPLLYLDLLGILSEAGREKEYRQFREQFVRHFNATIPDCQNFANEGLPLSASPALLEHINNLRESPQVLDVIEACLLRNAAGSDATPFDLAAFRELLNMHGVACQQREKQL